MHKAIAYFFLGFCLGLAVVELTDGVPAKKVDYNRMYFNTRTIYRPYPNHHYYDKHLDTFNNQRPNSSGSSRSGGTTRTTPTVERSETHTGNVPQNDRKKN